MTNNISGAAVCPDQRADFPSLTCIVPALNEARNLEILLSELPALLATCALSAWEIIVVDDGSTDNTPALLQSCCQEPGIRYIQLSRNFGKEAALSAGLHAANGQVVVQLDADMQHPLELIPEMLARWHTGADAVFAVRAHREDEGWAKRVGSQLFYRILSGSRSRVVMMPDAGDFRLMDRDVVDALLQLPERTRFMKGLYAWVGFRSEAIEYVPNERQFGETKFDFFRLVGFAIDGITAFSTTPLRLMAMAGMALAFVSFLYGCSLVVEHLLVGHDVSGWATIVTAIFFFSGINLMAFGVLGIYIGRIFDEVKQRPLYIVRRSFGSMRKIK